MNDLFVYLLFKYFLYCKCVWLCLSRSLSQVSAVCAYSVSAIRDIFNEGKFKTPVAVETSNVKWVMYTGDVPVPRPGAVSLKTLKLIMMILDMKPKIAKLQFCISVHQ